MYIDVAEEIAFCLRHLAPSFAGLIVRAGLLAPLIQHLPFFTAAQQRTLLQLGTTLVQQLSDTVPEAYLRASVLPALKHLFTFLDSVSGPVSLHLVSLLLQIAQRAGRVPELLPTLVDDAGAREALSNLLHAGLPEHLPPLEADHRAPAAFPSTTTLTTARLQLTPAQLGSIAGLAALVAARDTRLSSALLRRGLPRVVQLYLLCTLDGIPSASDSVTDTDPALRSASPASAGGGTGTLAGAGSVPARQTPAGTLLALLVLLSRVLPGLPPSALDGGILAPHFLSLSEPQLALLTYPAALDGAHRWAKRTPESDHSLAAVAGVLDSPLGALVPAVMAAPVPAAFLTTRSPSSPPTLYSQALGPEALDAWAILRLATVAETVPQLAGGTSSRLDRCEARLATLRRAARPPLSDVSPVTLHWVHGELDQVARLLLLSSSASTAGGSPANLLGAFCDAFFDTCCRLALSSQYTLDVRYTALAVLIQLVHWSPLGTLSRAMEQTPFLFLLGRTLQSAVRRRSTLTFGQALGRLATDEARGPSVPPASSPASHTSLLQSPVELGMYVLAVMGLHALRTRFNKDLYARWSELHGYGAAIEELSRSVARWVRRSAASRGTGRVPETDTIVPAWLPLYPPSVESCLLTHELPLGRQLWSQQQQQQQQWEAVASGPGRRAGAPPGPKILSLAAVRAAAAPYTALELFQLQQNTWLDMHIGFLEWVKGHDAGLSGGTGKASVGSFGSGDGTDGVPLRAIAGAFYLPDARACVLEHGCTVTAPGSDVPGQDPSTAWLVHVTRDVLAEHSWRVRAGLTGLRRLLLRAPSTLAPAQVHASNLLGRLSDLIMLPGKVLRDSTKELFKVGPAVPNARRELEAGVAGGSGHPDQRRLYWSGYSLRALRHVALAQLAAVFFERPLPASVAALPEPSTPFHLPLHPLLGSPVGMPGSTSEPSGEVPSSHPPSVQALLTLLRKVQRIVEELDTFPLELCDPLPGPGRLLLGALDVPAEDGPGPPPRVRARSGPGSGGVGARPDGFGYGLQCGWWLHGPGPRVRSMAGLQYLLGGERGDAWVGVGPRTPLTLCMERVVNVRFVRLGDDPAFADPSQTTVTVHVPSSVQRIEEYLWMRLQRHAPRLPFPAQTRHASELEEVVSALARRAPLPARLDPASREIPQGPLRGVAPPSASISLSTLSGLSRGLLGRSRGDVEVEVDEAGEDEDEVVDEVDYDGSGEVSPPESGENPDPVPRAFLERMTSMVREGSGLAGDDAEQLLRVLLTRLHEPGVSSASSTIGRVPDTPLTPYRKYVDRLCQDLGSDPTALLGMPDLSSTSPVGAGRLFNPFPLTGSGAAGPPVTLEPEDQLPHSCTPAYVDPRPHFVPRIVFYMNGIPLLPHISFFQAVKISIDRAQGRLEPLGPGTVAAFKDPSVPTDGLDWPPGVSEPQRETLWALNEACACVPAHFPGEPLNPPAAGAQLFFGVGWAPRPLWCPCEEPCESGSGSGSSAGAGTGTGTGSGSGGHGGASGIAEAGAAVPSPPGPVVPPATRLRLRLEFFRDALAGSAFWKHLTAAATALPAPSSSPPPTPLLPFAVSRHLLGAPVPRDVGGGGPGRIPEVAVLDRLVRDLPWYEGGSPPTSMDSAWSGPGSYIVYYRRATRLDQLTLLSVERGHHRALLWHGLGLGPDGRADPDRLTCGADLTRLDLALVPEGQGAQGPRAPQLLTYQRCGCSQDDDEWRLFLTSAFPSWRAALDHATLEGGGGSPRNVQASLRQDLMAMLETAEQQFYTVLWQQLCLVLWTRGLAAQCFPYYPGGVRALQSGFVPARSREVDRGTVGPFAYATPAYDALRTLRVLHALNMHLDSMYLQDPLFEAVSLTHPLANAATCAVPIPLGQAAPIPESHWHLGLLGLLVERQADAPGAVVGECLPAWLLALLRHLPFVLPLELRHLLAVRTALPLARQQYELTRTPTWEAALSRDRAADRGRAPRHRLEIVRAEVNRNRVVLSLARQLEDNLQRRRGTEFKFQDEDGVGRGPTLELYTLASQAFRQDGRGLWLGDTTTDLGDLTPMVESSDNGSMTLPVPLPGSALDSDVAPASEGSQHPRGPVPRRLGARVGGVAQWLATPTVASATPASTVPASAVTAARLDTTGGRATSAGVGRVAACAEKPVASGPGTDVTGPTHGSAPTRLGGPDAFTAPAGLGGQLRACIDSPVGMFPRPLAVYGVRIVPEALFRLPRVRVPGSPLKWSVKAPQPLASSQLHILKSLLRAAATVGRMTGQVFLERLGHDLHLARPVYQYIVGEPLGIDSLVYLAGEHGQVWQELLTLYRRRLALAHAQVLGNGAAGPAADPDVVLQYHGSRLSTLGLVHVAYGLGEFPLSAEGGRTTLTVQTLAQFLEGMLRMLGGDGAFPLLAELAAGVHGYVALHHIQGRLSAAELELLVGGEPLTGAAPRFWTRAHFEQHIMFSAGYTRQSPLAAWFLDYLVELGPHDRRQFLLFLLGRPSLPPGGFGALERPFTVALRRPAHSDIPPDTMLPSVMTCKAFLKIPQYSSKEVLHTRLNLAIHEGAGAFHLT